MSIFLTLLFFLNGEIFAAARRTAVVGALGQRSSYSYDAVGNRLTRTTSGQVSQIIPSQSQSFTDNDHLGSDTYDANGNTTESVPAVPAGSSASVTDVYSFDNKLIRRTNSDGTVIDLLYNTDGHRVSKLVSQNGLTQRLTTYLTDANNPTGYAQVIEEKDPLDATNPLRKVNLYGHDLICTDSSSSNQPSTLNHQLSYYSYDGLGSVRGITDENGDLQETYDYDSYGILIGLAKRNPSTGELESAGPTNPAIKPRSEFLYTGEQWDADLGMYFLRARYLNTNTGRFHTPDTYEGRKSEPLSQHKYLYVHANPISGIDPSGHMFLTELSVVEGELIRDKTSDSERVSSEAVPVKNGLKEIINKSGRFTYRSAKKVRDMLPNKELYETHHIIEKRLLDKIPELANLLTESELPAVILEKAEHQVITNAWRAAFPYGIEGAVESSQVIAEAAKIYANYPVLFQSVETILSAL